MIVGYSKNYLREKDTLGISPRGGIDEREFNMKLIKVFSVATLMLFTSSILADNAAFIDTTGKLCGALNDVGELVITNDTRIVSTQDPDTGDTHVKCRFETSPTESGHAFVDEGFPCGVMSAFFGLLITTDSHVRQTPKGDLVLTCHAQTD